MGYNLSSYSVFADGLLDISLRILELNICNYAATLDGPDVTKFLPTLKKKIMVDASITVPTKMLWVSRPNIIVDLTSILHIKHFISDFFLEFIYIFM